jgi:TolQ protein
MMRPVDGVRGLRGLALGAAVLLIAAAVSAQEAAPPAEPAAPAAPEAAAPPADAAAQPGAPAAPVDPNAPPAPAATAAVPGAPTPPVPEVRAPGEKEVPRQLERDMSAWGMFRDATLVPKMVMVLLFFLSMWNGVILIEKWWRIRSVNRRADDFLDKFRAAKWLEDLSKDIGGNPTGPMAGMFVAGMNEFHASVDAGVPLTGEHRDRLRERIEASMNVVESLATQDLGGSMSVLATVGSTAPFIGLFGTVWGIMNSFIGIAQTQTTNLAVVAPGIAEALLATAIGLFAAIPAVMLYNWFSRGIGTFVSRLESFKNEFSLALSRQIDHGLLGKVKGA